MYQHAPRYARVVLPLLLAVAAGCNRSADTATSPAPPALQAEIRAEPLAAQPEFITGSLCHGRQPFGIRVFISFDGRVILVHGLRFEFVDFLGNRFLPDVFPLSSPTSPATSLPSSSPVPVPGIAAVPPLRTGDRAGFFARFSCEVVPRGTLIITGDLDGRSSQVRVMVANP